MIGRRGFANAIGWAWLALAVWDIKNDADPGTALTCATVWLAASWVLGALPARDGTL